MKRPEIYKTAIMALIAREENAETRELNEDEFCESLYALSSDYHYWAEKNEAVTTDA